jgi:signal transduction histidine kinase
MTNRSGSRTDLRSARTHDTMYPRPPVILVVDDLDQNRRLATSILSRAGYEVVSFESGEAALAEAPQHDPDLVVLDVMMPGMDGFETCRRLRALPICTETPIMFHTALDDLDAYRRALAAGADDFLVKPIRHGELLIRVRSLIRLRRLSRELEAQAKVSKRQRDELATLQRQKDELMALVVHDLKSPLAVMTMDAQFALQRAKLDPDLRDCLESIESSTETMSRMVLNLLDISRAEDHALVLRRTPTSIDELVAVVARSLRRRAAEKRHRLEVKSDPAIADVDVDLLRRVLENLVDNACKYTPAGGAIVIEVAAREGRVHLCVSDEGPGIPEHARERIFDKYAQLEGRRDVHSRGLGLTFCKLAVEAHGGRIWVAENHPKGSRFCIALGAQEAT